MSEHEHMAAKAYEAARQQQQGRADAAPAWKDLPKGAREAITSAVVYGWGAGHGEGLELGQRQAGRAA